MAMERYNSIETATAADIILSLILPIQCRIFRFFGLLSCQGNTKQIVTRIIGGCAVAFNCFHFTFILTGFIAELQVQMKETELAAAGSDTVVRFNPLVYVMKESVFIVMNLRALLVMALFFFDQSLLRRLFAGSKKFLISCFKVLNYLFLRKRNVIEFWLKRCARENSGKLIT